MHRFFIAADSLHEEYVILTGSQVHQICDVLRMKSGDEIIVLDNTGCEYVVMLSKVVRQEVVGRVINKQKTQAEPKTRITFFQSLLSREKFELVLQKCTEIGVAGFVPVVTQRSIIRRADVVKPRKLSRWRSIITEAAEQSCRGRIPGLENPVYFSDAISGLDNFDLRLIGTIGTKESGLREILQAGDNKPTKVAVFIGPEGGFSESEIALACENGAKSFSLGKRILRTETAAVVASALILYELEG
jgi:16S rRNA (uracil1498-N3)-methyltransferase